MKETPCCSYRFDDGKHFTLTQMLCGGARLYEAVNVKIRPTIPGGRKKVIFTCIECREVIPTVRTVDGD